MLVYTYPYFQTGNRSAYDVCNLTILYLFLRAIAVHMMCVTDMEGCVSRTKVGWTIAPTCHPTSLTCLWRDCIYCRWQHPYCRHSWSELPISTTLVNIPYFFSPSHTLYPCILSQLTYTAVWPCLYPRPMVPLLPSQPINTTSQTISPCLPPFPPYTFHIITLLSPLASLYPINPQYGHAFIGGLWSHYSRAVYFLMTGQLGYPPPYISLDGGGVIASDKVGQRCYARTGTHPSCGCIHPLCYCCWILLMDLDTSITH